PALRRRRDRTREAPRGRRLRLVPGAHLVRHARALALDRCACRAALQSRLDRRRELVSTRLSRRRLLASAGAGGLTIAVGGGIAAGCGSDESTTSDQAVPFYGAHQAGIATPAQDRLHFAAFDVVTDSAAARRELRRTWTDAAARMSVGEPAGPVNDVPSAPPDDTGEAVGLSTGRLTVTFGFGPTLFEQRGEDRFGLASK